MQQAEQKSQSVSSSIFDEFVGKYSLSKTLRFELRIPEEFPGTRKMLQLGKSGDDFRFFDADKIRKEKYEKTKPWIDRLHREFIEDALRDFRFQDLSKYYDALESWKKEKKSKEKKKKLEQEESALRKEIVSRFDSTAERWIEEYSDIGLKKKNKDFLFEEGVFRLMAKRYGHESGTVIQTENGETNIFDDWKGWVGYFDKFFQTRKNFYLDEDKPIAITYRIVNQNLRRFCENAQAFKEIRRKINIRQIEHDLGVSCEEIFSLEYYNRCLLQSGIDEYNRVLGGYIGDNDAKIPGINQAINEYRQKNKGEKVKFLAMLDKQIHSEKERFIDAIEDEQEFFDRLALFAAATETKLGSFRRLMEDFSKNIGEYSAERIYISSDAFERNAGRWFSDYASFESALVETGKEKKWKDAYGATFQSPPEKEEDRVRYPDFLIFGHISEALERTGVGALKEKYQETIAGFSDMNPTDAFIGILRYETNQQFERNGNEREGVLGYDPYRQKIKEILDNPKAFKQEDIRISVKQFADSALTIYQMAKYFAVEKKRRWLEEFELDDRFYMDPAIGYRPTFYDAANTIDSAYAEIVQGYNALRNYLTKKPYDTNKWLLKFDIQTLADGFDKNKEKDNGAVILRKDGVYYLGIMHKDHRDLFTEKFQSEYAGTGYEKLEYKFFPEASKMIPKCSTQLSDVHKHFEKNESDYVLFKREDFLEKVVISRRIYDLNNIYYRKSNIDESFVPKNNNEKKDGVKRFQKEYLNLSKNQQVYREALTDWISFCIAFLKSYKSTSIFDFSKLKSPEEYRSLDEFYSDINNITYSHIFKPISSAYIQKKNEDGELFIFEIHNKDWNLKDGEKKSGTKNLHTIYWENLFSDENASRNFILKLNGQAEVFFRPKTSYEKLGVKNGLLTKDGKPIVNRFRYASDKIFFHCPITLNRVSEGKTPREMNGEIRRFIAGERRVNIIGIDRGEKNLVYYYVIDQDGNRIDEGSLNALGESNGKTVEYAKILENRAKSRETARREWKDVEQIKDTKRGFVSQMVRKITDLAIAHNAIIVLEDLNMRFKQVRGGIEKSIYQQFEKQLIDKLSFVVMKGETDPEKSGHALRAYQLASPVSAFKDMGKQTGIVFYTAAGYTSRTCPVCGYRRNVRFQFENRKQAIEMIRLLDRFEYDPKQDAFVVGYSLSKMLNREQLKESKAKNKLFESVNRKDSFVITSKDALRYRWVPIGSPRLRALISGDGVADIPGIDDDAETKKGSVKKIDITAYLKNLFSDEGIDISEKDMKSLILKKEGVGAAFLEKLFFALFLLTETRQSISGTETDYIHCPDCGFYSNPNGGSLFQGKAFSGDANGAFNIARKGIMIIEKIRQFEQQGHDIMAMQWGDLAIDIEEWDKFTQTRSRNYEERR